MAETLRKLGVEEKAQNLSLLKEIPLLKNLHHWERAKVAEHLHVRSYKDGDYVVKQGEEADEFFIVRDGLVDVVIDCEDGSTKIVSTISKRGWFGELALLKNEPRMASIVAKTDVECLVLLREDFKRLIGPLEQILHRKHYIAKQKKAVERWQRSYSIVTIILTLLKSVRANRSRCMQKLTLQFEGDQYELSYKLYRVQETMQTANASTLVGLVVQVVFWMHDGLQDDCYWRGPIWQAMNMIIFCMFMIMMLLRPLNQTTEVLAKYMSFVTFLLICVLQFYPWMVEYRKLVPHSSVFVILRVVPLFFFLGHFTPVWVIRMLLRFGMLVAACEAVMLQDRMLGYETAGYKADTAIAVIASQLLLVTILLVNFFDHYRLERNQRSAFILATDIQNEWKASEAFLQTMLPGKAVEALKHGQKLFAEWIVEGTIVFVKICDFNHFVENLPPRKLINFLNHIYSEFDNLMDKHSLYKIETVNEYYMAGSGILGRERLNAEFAAVCAVEMVEVCKQMSKDNESSGVIRVTIGINTGSMIAGVIGLKQVNYRVFGDAVNMSSRMCSASSPGMILASEATAKKLKASDEYVFNLEDRGLSEIKGKGEQRTFFVKDAVKLESSNKQLNIPTIEEDMQPNKDLNLENVLDLEMGTALTRTASTKRTKSPHRRLKRLSSIEVSMSKLSFGRDSNPAEKLVPDSDKTASFTSNSSGRDSIESLKQSSFTEGVNTEIKESRRVSAPSVVKASSSGANDSPINIHMVDVKRGSVGHVPPVSDEPPKTIEEILAMPSPSRSKSMHFGKPKEDGWRSTSFNTRALKKRSEPNIAVPTNRFISLKSETPGTRVNGGVGSREGRRRSIVHDMWKKNATQKSEKVTMHPVTLHFIGNDAEDLDELYHHCRRYKLKDEQASSVTGLVAVSMIKVVLEMQERENHDYMAASFLIKVVLSYFALMFFQKKNEMRFMREMRILHNQTLVFIIVCCMCASVFVHSFVNPPKIVAGDLVLGVLAVHYGLQACIFQVQVMWTLLISLFLPGIGYLLVITTSTAIHSKMEVTTGICILLIHVGMMLFSLHKEERKRKMQYLVRRDLLKQHKVFEQLIFNLVPSQIVSKLRSGNTLLVEQHPDASVLFADIKGFTPLTASVPAVVLVGFLNTLFSALDDLCLKEKVYKVNTIGDCYVVAAGVPMRVPYHAEAAMEFARKMLHIIYVIREDISQFRPEFKEIAMRIGIHSGAVTSGVVGKKSIRYEIWGETVDIANKMEATGVPMRIHCSQDTQTFLRYSYSFEYRPLSGTYLLVDMDQAQKEGIELQRKNMRALTDIDSPFR